MNELELVVSTTAGIACIVGYLAWIYLQMWRPEKRPIQETVPLLCISTIMGLIWLSGWYVPPFSKLLYRGVAAVFLLAAELALIKPAFSRFN